VSSAAVAWHPGDADRSDVAEEAGQDWSAREVRVIVDHYLWLLDAHLAGERVNKRASYRDLIEHELPVRTLGSVEMKLQNISAVMVNQGVPFVGGLRPMQNFQGRLEEEVLRVLRQRDYAPRLDEFVNAAAERAEFGYLEDPDDSVVPVPTWDPRSRPSPRAVHVDWDQADRERRRIGLLGEEWVVDWERRRLFDKGRKDLASKVVHTSKEEGDGAGYDVASFGPDGSERLIEVKTTAAGQDRMFYVSKNEVEVSRERADNYWLYRVFDFWSERKMFQIGGSLDSTLALDPRVFAARPLEARAAESQ